MDGGTDGAGLSPTRSRLRALALALGWMLGFDLLILLGALVFDRVGGWLWGPAITLGLMALGVQLVSQGDKRGLAPPDPRLSGLTLLALFTPLAGAFGDDGVGVLVRGTAAQVAVSELPSRNAVALVDLAGGKLHPELGAVLHTTTRTSGARGTPRSVTRTLEAAPLAAPGWTREEPVQAWVVASGGLAWTPGQALAVLHPGVISEARWLGRDRFMEAVEDSCRRHDLRSAPGAPLLVPTHSSLEDEVRWRLGWLVGWLALFNGVVALLVLSRPRRSAPQSPAAARSPGDGTPPSPPPRPSAS